MDDRHPKGTATGVNPDVTGGSADHFHTSAAHSHSLTSHSHTGTYPANAVTRDKGDDATVPAAHTHTYATGAIGGTSTSDTSGNWSTESNEPANFKMIWIKSDGTPTGFPADSVVFYDGATAPNNWIQHVGSKARFLVGAAPGGDGGGTAGGAHTHTPGAHTHTSPNHTHGNFTTDNSSSGIDVRSDGNDASTRIHNHSGTLAGSDGSVASGPLSGGASGSTTYEPSLHTLLAIENDLAGADLPDRAIVKWLKTLASIPAPYVLCDGASGTPDLRGKFIKCANVGGDVGTTGGSDGHQNSSGSHTHTASHNHSVNVSGAGPYLNNAAQSGLTVAPGGHTHPSHTSGSTDPGLAGASPTLANNSDTQPPFRTVAYLQIQATSRSSIPALIGI